LGEGCSSNSEKLLGKGMSKLNHLALGFDLEQFEIIWILYFLNIFYLQKG